MNKLKLKSSDLMSNVPGVLLAILLVANSIAWHASCSAGPCLPTIEEGDYTEDRHLDLDDLLILQAAIKNYQFNGGPYSSKFDLFADNALTDADIVRWLEIANEHNEGIDLDHIDYDAGDVGISGALTSGVAFEGYVDHYDLEVVLANFGLDGDWTQGNFNGDCVIDVVDLMEVLGNWNPPEESGR